MENFLYKKFILDNAFINLIFPQKGMTVLNFIQKIVLACKGKQKEISIAVGIVLAVFLTQQSSFSRVCGQIRQDTLRLHIRAASDSAADQQDKLAVRDAILEQAEMIFAGQNTREQAEVSAQKNLDKIQQIAENVLKKRGSNNTASVYLTDMFFDTIKYENFTMPAGEYKALRVDIGKAEGKNWWCVMFPPLCVPSAQQVQQTTAYSPQEKNVLQSKFEIRFALVELWQQLFSKKPVYDGC